MKKSLATGYTLIEIIVALALFAIVATLSTSAIQRAFDTRARLIATTDRLNAFLFVVNLIQRDAIQIQNRAVRSQDMHLLPPFLGETDYLEFTRAGLINPNGLEGRSSFKRVALVCIDDYLVRRTWDVLDSPNHQLFHDKILLSHLSQCEFGYIARNHQRLANWRPYALQQNQVPEPLPSALELSIDIPNLGPAKLLFIIPEALYGA